MSEKDILEKNTWNTKQLVTSIIVTASIVFAASMIWSRFLFVETANKSLEERIEYVNDRIDTKHNSQREYIDQKVKVLTEDNINQWGVMGTKKDK